MSVDVSTAISVKQQNLQRLLTRKNVVGVGVGYKESQGVLTDEVAVTINVAQKIPAAQLAESDQPWPSPSSIAAFPSPPFSPAGAWIRNHAA